MAKGEPVDQQELDRLAEESTLDVIRKQAQAEVDVINSGEQSRTSFLPTFITPDAGTSYNLRNYII